MIVAVDGLMDKDGSNALDVSVEFAKRLIVTSPTKSERKTDQASDAMNEIVDRDDGSTQPIKPPIEGFVDTLTRQDASGWAWLPDAPKVVVEIEAIYRGKVIGRSRAERPRPDLLKWGKGTGLYGFSIAFDDKLEGDEIPEFLAVGFDACPLPIDAKLPPTKVTPLKPPKNYDLHAEGHVDSLTHWGATGWAWAPKAPERSVLVEAVLGDRVIGRARAAEFRPDLLKWGKGTGLYGFMMRFEEALHEELPEFRVLVDIPNYLPGAADLPPQDANSKQPRSRGTISTLLQDHAHFTSRGPEFEEFDPSILDHTNAFRRAKDPILVAFYLPQFHPIPENDRFWGKGFTEWRQMPRGLPRYPGHYQPRIPGDLGFYNLEAPDVLSRQVALARSAGINAFAYYYYWFNSKRVLEKPLEALLQSDVDMPFMLIWANENWTRTWDGAESSVLLRQDYRQEDEEALLSDFARHFDDHRYVRLQGRPLFVIYNPRHIPDPKETIGRWRKSLLERHGHDAIFFMAQTFGEQDPEPFGLDGAIEFPPHKLSDNLPGRPTPDAYSSDFSGRVIDYDDFSEASLKEAEKPFPLIKTIVPSWDNDSRRPNRGLSLENISPRKYQAWLHALIEKAIAKPVFGKPIVAINAWNEWAEGAYLEPDVYYGAAYLNATARAVTQAASRSRVSVSTVRSEHAPPVSVILPNFNHERFLKERLESVLAQSHKPSEIIFLDDCSSDGSVGLAKSILAKSDIPYRIITNKENSGCVFRQWIKGLELARSDLIWIAETDDAADPDFLAHLAPCLAHSDVNGAFGHIRCIDENAASLPDLDGYFDNLLNFSWDSSCVVTAYQAFKRDFVIRNVVPNASGFVFRKPQLSVRERERLLQYSFAGDWYFYALVLRGGKIAYEPKAKSYFRLNRSGTSRSAFSTDRHLKEHKMVLEDLSSEYNVSNAALRAHVEGLLSHFPGRQFDDLWSQLAPKSINSPRLRICIAAHSFEVGGGEILPLELANALKQLGLHVTYLVMEDEPVGARRSVRARLRSDIPVVSWADVRDDFDGFLETFGIQVFNSHNVSVEYSLFCNRIEIDIPYVSSLHGGYETVPNLLTEEFAAYLRRTVDRWMFLAAKNTTLLKKGGIAKDRFERSFNAVPSVSDGLVNRADFRREHGIPENGFVTFLCSRAIPEKGWREAIEAVQLVRALGNQPVWLVLIGEGPNAAELRHTYGSIDWVIFLGHVDNPSRYFGCFDLGVFPSTFSGETFPLFLVECFQAGKPVVATDIGEIPSIVGHDPKKRAGVLLPQEADRIDLVYALAEAIAALKKSPERYERMRANAVEASTRFSMTRLADTYNDLFAELISVTEEATGRMSVSVG